MALVSNIVIECPEAQGIKCKFTGRPTKIVAHVCEGVVTYSVPKAFSLYEPQASIDLLYQRASMRNGLMGVVDKEQCLIDPYTGKQMTLRETPDGRFYFDGGFDPACASLSLPDLIRNLTGRTVESAPEAVSIEHPGDMTPDDSDLAHKQVEDLTEAAAEKMVKVIPGATHGRTTVSMSTPSRKGK